jgi:thiamine-phosphate diphosphorylase
VHLVQVRERDLEGRALTDLVARCVAAVRGTRTRVVVNERFDVALAAGAHGVHLRAGSMAAARVRAAAPPGFLIGRSVHAPEEAAGADSAGGLDYLIFGTVFASASKPGRAPAGLAALAAAVSAARVPVLAVGGVTPDKLREVAATGAAGFAAIGMFAAAAEASLAQAVTRAASAWGDRID